MYLPAGADIVIDHINTNPPLPVVVPLRKAKSPSDVQQTLSDGASSLQVSLDVVLKIISDGVVQSGIRLGTPDGYYWSWSSTGSSPALAPIASQPSGGYIVTTYLPKPTGTLPPAPLKTVTLY